MKVNTISETTASTVAETLPTEQFAKELKAEQAQARAEPAELRAKQEAAALARATADNAILKAGVAEEPEAEATFREAKAAAAAANKADKEVTAAKAKEQAEINKKEVERAAEFETRIINASHVANANEAYILQKAFSYIFEDETEASEEI